MNCRRFAARGSLSSPTPPASAASLAEIPESQIEPRPKEPLECIAPSLHGSLTPWVQWSICRQNVFGCLWPNMVVPVVPCFLINFPLWTKGRLSKVLPECVASVPISLWGFGGWGCVRQTLCNRSQPGCIYFFPGLPCFRIRSRAIAARSSTEILMDTAMLIDLPDFTTMRSPDVISCHGYSLTDLLSWFAYVVMQNSSFQKELGIESM